MVSREKDLDYLRFTDASVVVWTLERQTSETSLYIKAALILCAGVCSCHTLINI